MPIPRSELEEFKRLGLELVRNLEAQRITASEYPPLPPEYVADIILQKVVIVEVPAQKKPKKRKEPTTWYWVTFADEQRPHTKKYSLAELEQQFAQAVSLQEKI